MSTMEQRFVAALEARGERLVKTGRYRVFTRTMTVHDRVPTTRKIFYYVGAAGALRIGPTAGASRPADADAKKILLEEGDKELDNRKEEARQASKTKALR